MSLTIDRFNLFVTHENTLICGLSTRFGGISMGQFESMNLGFALGDTTENVKTNFKIFANNLGLEDQEILFPVQEHTDKILKISEETLNNFKNPFQGYDGMITNLSDIPLMVRFADCQGVFLFDPDKKVICALHSGWRGNAQNIVGKGVKMMKEEYGCEAKNVLMGVSPSLGPCCAAFTDPIKELPPDMHKYIKGKKVDLWSCTKDQAIEEGIKPENIEFVGKCSKCNPDRYFSYRGAGGVKGVCGRMGGVIMLKSSFRQSTINLIKSK